MQIDKSLSMYKRIFQPESKDTRFPVQKKSDNQKTESWAVSCIEGAENLTLFSNYEVRQSYYNKKKNYDLANDIIDIRDVQQVCSPLGLDMSTFPATMQNYPLVNPKLKLLIGEEMKRKFEWRVRSTNPHVANSKLEVKKDELLKLLSDIIYSENQQDEERIKAKLQELEKKFKYSYQDIREKMASDILKYLYKKLDLQTLFSKGFYDALISAEEIYSCDIVAGEPRVRKVNPLTVFTYGTDDSPYLDDADIIIEDSYMSVGKVIDEFYEYLKDTDIRNLEDKHFYGTGSRGVGDTLNYKNMFPVMNVSTFVGEPLQIDTTQIHNRFGGFWDEAGNIRVTRVVWKSRRKIGKLSYYDQMGDQQQTLVDEYYKPNKELGEEIEWLWINEYWEGTRIGKDLYVKIQPRPVQYRSINNLSKCKSGYVGTVYNINSSRARSLFDQAKPYQYLYNIFMYRTELAFAKYKGPIMEINSAMIPQNWDLDKWLYYAEVLGYAMMNPFNESAQGASTGTLAGSMNTVGGKILSDDSVGNYINANIQMLSYIEKQIGNITGVTEQRQGQIEQRELVGNVERSVSQSSHITEHWFTVHEHTKLRVLEVLLETAKYCYREETDMTLNFVLDDMSSQLLKLDGRLLNEADYAIFINNAAKDQEFEQSLKQLAHAGLQNDKLNFADVIKVFSANNLTDMAKAIEDAEERKLIQQQEMQKQQQEHEQQIAQQQQASQEKMMQMQIENREDEQAARLEEIRVKAAEDRATLILQKQVEGNKEVDTTYLDEAKLMLDEKIRQKELELKEKAIKEAEDTKRMKIDSDAKLREKELKQAKEIAEKEIAVKRIAANKKPASSSK